MTLGRFLSASSLVVVALSCASSLYAQADVVEKRQKLMKSNGAAAKAIKGAVAEKDHATVEMKAKEIMGNADRILDLFPKGSAVGKTKAKAEIWEKPDEFSKNRDALKKAASELAEAAAAKNDAKVDTAFKAAGTACGSCHKAFRTKEYAQ